MKCRDGKCLHALIFAFLCGKKSSGACALPRKAPCLSVPKKFPFLLIKKETIKALTMNDKFILRERNGSRKQEALIARFPHVRIEVGSAYIYVKNYFVMSQSGKLKTLKNRNKKFRFFMRIIIYMRQKANICDKTIITLQLDSKKISLTVYQLILPH